MNRIVRRSVPRLLSAAALALALTACRGNAKPGEAELPPASGAGAPARADLPDLADNTATIAVAGGETTGTTYPRARAEMGPPLSGVIADIAVEEGDPVRKGQVLFRLRTSDLALHVQQARAAAATAAVNVASVQVEFDRMQRLYDKKAVEQAQYDRVKAQLDAARAGASQAAIMVSMAQQVMSDSVVRSPIDGVVTHKLKNAGEMATMMPPTIVLVVEDHSVLELRFRLPEQMLGTVAVGDKIGATFSAAAGARREAEVVRISPNVDPTTRTVEIVAMLDNRDGALKAGMLATVALAGAAPAAAPATAGARMATP